MPLRSRASRYLVASEPRQPSVSQLCRPMPSTQRAFCRYEARKLSGKYSRTHSAMCKVRSRTGPQPNHDGRRTRNCTGKRAKIECMPIAARRAPTS